MQYLTPDQRETLEDVCRIFVETAGDEQMTVDRSEAAQDLLRAIRAMEHAAVMYAAH